MVTVVMKMAERTFVRSRGSNSRPWALLTTLLFVHVIMLTVAVVAGDVQVKSRRRGSECRGPVRDRGFAAQLSVCLLLRYLPTLIVHHHSVTPTTKVNSRVVFEKPCRLHLDQHGPLRP